MAARTPAKRLMMSSRSARGSGKFAGRSRNLPGRGIADADHRVAPAITSRDLHRESTIACSAVRHSLPAREAIHEADPEQISGVFCPGRRRGGRFHANAGLTVVQDAGGVWLTIQRMP